jgi:hypothetical protein
MLRRISGQELTHLTLGEGGLDAILDTVRDLERDFDRMGQQRPVTMKFVERRCSRTLARKLSPVGRLHGRLFHNGKAAISANLAGSRPCMHGLSGEFHRGSASVTFPRDSRVVRLRRRAPGGKPMPVSMVTDSVTVSILSGTVSRTVQVST